MNFNRGISTLAGIAIIAVAVIVAFAGVFTYQYLLTPKEPKEAIESPTDREVKTIEYFIPKDWQLMQTVEGDSNNDGLEDAVIVIEEREHKIENVSSCDDFKGCPRSMLILFQIKEGGYRLSIKSDKAILSAGEGGIFGDPFEGLQIDEGSLLINFYGGSAWRWSYSYKFRYQDNGWFLTGAASYNYWNVSDCVDKLVDCDFLTNRKKEIISSNWDNWNSQDSAPCGREEKWSDIESRKLISLEDFEASAFDISEFCGV